jgi:hypothetical protein
MKKIREMPLAFCLIMLATASVLAKEVPAGTTLVVRMIDSVDSTKNSPGETFRAVLDEPVMVDGETLIPRDADVTTKLISTKRSGKITGRSELTIDIVNISFLGRTIDVNTSESTSTGKSRTRESAVVVGGGAALGAIIGGIAGGGKGAAIGAASGAGAGTAVQILTRGKQVRVPSESRLHFVLQHPVRL